MNINRYALCKERSLQKIISKQPKPNTTAIGVCSETQVTHHITTKRSDECLPISAYVPKHKEGDGEGRSITDLGVFEGNIDTIALALADRCYYYTLYFTAVDPTAYDKAPKKDEINISIYGASGMYDMTKEERLDAMRNMLKDRPVFVRDGDRADTFIISTKQESREKRRQKVLDKLTAEERELLGV